MLATNIQKYIRGNILFLIMLAAITLLFIYSIYWLLVLYEENRTEYIDSERKLRELRIENIISSFEDLSFCIFEQLQSSEKVLEILKQASSADYAKQEILRRQLYDHLESDNQQIVNLNFHKLHFYLPDGYSFLSFNNPELYGDNLRGERESIKITGEEKMLVHGFEVGRNFYSYRFVYSLYHEKDFTGIVEISVSFNSLLKSLNQRYPMDYALFMISKESIMDSQKEMTQGQNNVFDNFIIDSEDHLYIFLNYCNREMPIFTNLVRQISEKSIPNIDKNIIFSYHLRDEGRDYLLHFIPLKNTDNINIGHFLSFTEDKRLGLKQARRNRELSLFAAIYLSIVGTLFVYNYNKNLFKQMAITDKLTGIYNRQEFHRLAKKEFSRCKRYNQVLCLLMIDIDLFKKINDTYGHATGDDVLQNFAVQIGRELRETDLFARWGGEEFVILMPETNLENALVVAERLRDKVANYVFSNRENKLVKITISTGITVIKQEDIHIDQVISRSDKALYRAKCAGRNRVSKD